MHNYKKSLRSLLFLTALTPLVLPLTAIAQEDRHDSAPSVEVNLDVLEHLKEQPAVAIPPATNYAPVTSTAPTRQPAGSTGDIDIPSQEPASIGATPVQPAPVIPSTAPVPQAAHPDASVYAPVIPAPEEAAPIHSPNVPSVRHIDRDISSEPAPVPHYLPKAPIEKPVIAPTAPPPLIAAPVPAAPAAPVITIDAPAPSKRPSENPPMDNAFPEHPYTPPDSQGSRYERKSNLDIPQSQLPAPVAVERITPPPASVSKPVHKKSEHKHTAKPVKAPDEAPVQTMLVPIEPKADLAPTSKPHPKPLAPAVAPSPPKVKPHSAAPAPMHALPSLPAFSPPKVLPPEPVKVLPAHALPKLPIAPMISPEVTHPLIKAPSLPPIEALPSSNANKLTGLPPVEPLPPLPKAGPGPVKHVEPNPPVVPVPAAVPAPLKLPEMPAGSVSKPALPPVEPLPAPPQPGPGPVKHTESTPPVVPVPAAVPAPPKLPEVPYGSASKQPFVPPALTPPPAPVLMPPSAAAPQHKGIVGMFKHMLGSQDNQTAPVPVPPAPVILPALPKPPVPAAAFPELPNTILPPVPGAKPEAPAPGPVSKLPSLAPLGAPQPPALPSHSGDATTEVKSGLPPLNSLAGPGAGKLPDVPKTALSALPDSAPPGGTTKKTTAAPIEMVGTAPLVTPAIAPEPGAPQAVAPKPFSAPVVAPAAPVVSTPNASGANLRIIFATTQTDVPLATAEPLDALAKKINANPNARVTVMAYAGGTEENASFAKRVSLARGVAIRNYLIDKGKVDKQRINVKAMGTKDAGTTDADRVELFLMQ